MRNRFQLGFLIGSLIPLAAICALGHSPAVCLAAGCGFSLLPALLWPSTVSRWLEGLGEFYQRVTSRPARSGRRQNPVSGPDFKPGANLMADSTRRRQDVVVSALVNFGCAKSKARAIAEAVACIPDEKERVYAAMRMVRA
jgi:hypothetical protein